VPQDDNRSEENLPAGQADATDARSTWNLVKTVLDGTPLGIVLLDKAGRVVIVNRSWRELIESADSDLANLSPGDDFAGSWPRGADPSQSDITAGVKSVIDGHRISFKAECALGNAPAASWGNLRVSRLSEPVGCMLVSWISNQEHRETVDALAAARAMLEATIEQTPAGILIADAPDVNIRIANSAVLSIRGQTNLPLTDIPYAMHPGNWQVFHADGLRYTPEDLPLSRAVLKGEVSRDNEVIIRREDGEDRWITASAAPVRDSKGRVIAGVAVFSDVTDRKRAEDELSASEHEKRVILNSLVEHVVYQDTERRVLWANQCACDSLGVDASEIIGRYCYQLWGDDGKPCEGCPVAKAMTTGQPQSLEKATDDGRSWFIRGYPVRDANGKIVGAIEVTLDVTDKKRAERALRESEERYNSLFEYSNDAIFICDLDGRIIDVNRKALALFVCSRSELLSRNMAELHPPGAREASRAAFRSLAATGSTQIEIEFQTSRGRVFPAELSAYTIWIGDKEVVQGIVRDTSERRRAEGDLRESKRTLTTLMGNLPGMAYRCRNDEQWTMTFVSDGCRALTGYASDDLLGNHRVAYNDIIHPDDKALVRASIERSIDGGRQFRITYRIITADGGEKWVWEQGTALITDDGQVESLEGFISDISEQKRVEQTLRRREATLASIFRAAPTGIGVVSDRVFKRVNESMCEMVGYTSNELVGRSARMLYVSEEEFDKVGREKYEQIRRSGTGTVEARWVKKDGTIIDVLLSSTPLDMSDLSAGVTFTALDITDRKLAEQALRESEGRYHELFESVIEGIGQINDREEIIYCNPAFAGVFGIDNPPDMVGRNMREFVAGSSREAMDAQYERLRQNQSVRVDMDILTVRNEARQAHLALSPRFSQSGRYLGCFLGIMDVTENRRLQEFASRAQRLETAGKIAGQVAHDFNNLLGPLLAYPELARDDLPEGHPVLTYLGDMERAARQIADINQQLLTLGRRGHYNQEPLNLNGIVSQVIKELDYIPETIDIETHLAEDLMLMKGGPAQIHRVVANLVNNALDSMQNHGRLTISTENHYTDLEAHRYMSIPPGEYVKLTMQDSGCGISGDLLPHIFEPFVSTKATDRKRGSGLGLSVVHAVVKDHDGFIDVETSIGTGTSFYLYFPITRETADTPAPDEIIGGSERILVVDDDIIQREVTLRLLTRLGYQAHAVTGGEEALTHLADHPQDLLLLDMIMPPGIDGTETFRRALEICPDQKAIILSGYAATDRVEKALQLGAHAFVRKPLSLAALASAVRRALDNAPASVARDSR